MQLWSKMAQQQATHNNKKGIYNNNNPLLANSNISPTASGLAANIRPHYFAAKSGPTLSALLSGKASLSTSTTTSGPSPSSAAQQPQPMPTPQQAMLATAASHTLLNKIGSAFWDAFARPSGALSPNGRAATRELDAEKVRKVMEGTAVVRVVDIDPPSVAQQQAQSQSQMERTSVFHHHHHHHHHAHVPGRTASLTDMLEESMSKLTLCKK